MSIDNRDACPSVVPAVPGEPRVIVSGASASVPSLRAVRVSAPSRVRHGRSACNRAPGLVAKNGTVCPRVSAFASATSDQRLLARVSAQDARPPVDGAGRILGALAPI